MDNREKILDCALDLFYQKGYDAVGIKEICQEAGISKPTLYYYFGSKAGLMEALLREEFTGVLQEIKRVSEKEMGIEQALDEYAEVLFRFAGKNPKAYMLFMAMSYSAKENELYQMVRPYMRELHVCTVEMFEHAAVQLGNMNNRQEQFAIGFLGVLTHYIMFMGFQEESDSIAPVSEEKRSSLIRQFMYGIWT